MMIFEHHGELRYKLDRRNFWTKGYYVSTVGLNEATIKKYIKETEIESVSRVWNLFHFFILESGIIIFQDLSFKISTVISSNCSVPLEKSSILSNSKSI